MIVNESMARHSWPGQRAVGRRMHVGNPKKGYPWATVVGVVADTTLGARDEPVADQWYCPARQPAILEGTTYSGQLTGPESPSIVLRSSLPPEQMIEPVTFENLNPLLDDPATLAYTLGLVLAVTARAD